MSVLSVKVGGVFIIMVVHICALFAKMVIAFSVRQIIVYALVVYLDMR